MKKKRKTKNEKKNTEHCEMIINSISTIQKVEKK